MYKVYKITNIKNNKVYVGYTSKTLEERLSKHFSSKNESDIKFRRAMKKYGKSNFKIELIEECDTKEEVLLKEIFHIQQLNAYDTGYNSTWGGESAPSIGRSSWNEHSHEKFIISKKKWYQTEDGIALKNRQSEMFKRIKPHQYVTEEGKRSRVLKHKQWLNSDAGKVARKENAVNMKRVQKLRHCGIFELQDPHGANHITSDIMIFCKENKLSYFSFYYSLNVTKKDNVRGKNKGWKIIRWNDKPTASVIPVS